MTKIVEFDKSKVVKIINYTTGEVLEVENDCKEGILSVLEIVIEWAKNGDTVTVNTPSGEEYFFDTILSKLK